MVFLIFFFLRVEIYVYIIRICTILKFDKINLWFSISYEDNSGSKIGMVSK